MNKKIINRIFFICLLAFPLLSNAQCAGPTAASATPVTATCTNNGKITITGVSGGATLTADTTLEYAIESYTGVGPSVLKLYQSDPVFTNLYPGTYSVSVRKNCLGKYSTAFTVSGITVAYSYTPMTGSVVVDWAESGCRLGKISTTVTGGNKAISGSYKYQLVSGLTSSLSDTLSAKQTSNSFRVPAGTYYVRIFDDCGSYITKMIAVTGSTVTTNPYANTSTYNMQRFTRSSCSTFVYNFYRPGSLRFSVHNLSPTGAKTYLFGPDKTAIDSFTATTSGTSGKDISAYISPTNLKVSSGLNTYGPFFEKVIDSCGVVYYSDSLYIDTSVTVAATLTRSAPRCDTANYTIALTQSGANYTGTLIVAKQYRVRVSNAVAGVVEYTNDSGATWSSTVTTTSNVLSSRALPMKFGVRVCGRVGWAAIPTVTAFNPAVLAASPWACVGNTGLALNGAGNFGTGTFAKSTFQITSAPAAYPHALSMKFTSTGKNAASATDTKSYLFNLPTGTYGYTVTNECGQTFSGTVNAGAGRGITPKLSAVGNCATGIIQLVPTVTTVQTGASGINAAGGASRLRYSIYNKRTGVYTTTGGAAGVATSVASTGANPTLTVAAINTTDTGWFVFTVWPDTAALFTSEFCPVKDSVYVSGVGSALRAKSDFIACKTGGLGTIVASHTGGLPPYKYELKNLSTGALKPVQYSPIFTGLDVTHSFEVRVTDTCGNSSVTSNTFDTVTMNVFLAGTSCHGAKTELRANDVPGAVYRWIRGVDTIGYERILPLMDTKYSDSGLYTLLLRPAGCDEEIISTIRFAVNPSPEMPIVADTLFNYCKGVATTTLSATGSSLKWWMDDTTVAGSVSAYTPVSSAADTFTYFVSQTSAAGCESHKKAIVVNINPIPSAPLTTAQTYCRYATATAVSATGSSLKWYDAVSGGTASTTAPTPSTAAPDTFTYLVSQTSVAGCESPRSSLGVRIQPIPDTPSAASSVAYCEGAVASALTATGTGLLWYTDATGGVGSPSAPTPSTATAGSTTYYVSQTNSLSCEGPRKAIVVTINPNPAAPDVVTPVNYCQDLAATALSAMGTDLLWYDLAAGGTGSTSAPTPVTSSPGTKIYYVSQKSDKGCEGPRAGISVQTNPTPAAALTTSVAYCSGKTATALTASGSSLLWYTAATGGTGSSTAPTPATAVADTFTYFVTQSSSYGCESPRASLGVRIQTTPDTPTAITSIAYCKDATPSILTATGTDLKWYDAATGGTASTTAPTPATTAAGSTTYYVSQTNTAGCESARKAITVTVNPNPDAPVVVTPLTYCQNYTALSLTATGTDLKWYDAASGGTASATAPVPSTTATGSTAYYVSQTSAKGCEGPRASITVNVNPTPAAPSVSSPVTYCSGAAASSLTATGTSLAWYTTSSGGTGSATAPTPSTSAAGTTKYYVTQSNSYSCESPRAEISVVINATPAAPAVATPVKYCVDQSATALTATGINLQWYSAATGGTGSSTAPTPGTATDGTQYYYVSQTSALGCPSARAEVEVKVNPNPVAPTVVTPVNWCNEASATALTATGINLKWYAAASGGTAMSGITPATTTVGATSYYVSQTSALGCESQREEIKVNVNPNPALTISPVDKIDFVYCPGSDLLIKANAPTAVSYQWDFETTPLPGAVNDTFRVNANGNYGVTVTNVFGCKNTKSVFVMQDTIKAPELSPTSINICDGVSIVLFCTPAKTGYSYEWMKDGVQMIPHTLTSPSKSVNEGGVYTVNVTNLYGCVTTTNSSTVNKYPKLPAAKIVRMDPKLSLTHAYTYYQWYRNGVAIAGANSATYTMMFDGKYHVMVKDVNGCTANSDTVNVNKLGLENVDLAEGSIKLYPNPTQNIVHIDAPLDVTLRITDVAGRTVWAAEKANQVDLSNFADGTYLFILSDTEGRQLGVQRINKISN